MAPRHEILVIEHNEHTLEDLASALEAAGYKVTKAMESEKALHYATSGSFDLAVLDYRMPGLSGLDLLRPLKGRMPVIVFSPDISEATREKAMEEGAAAVVSGLITWPDILNAVEVALNPESMGLRALIADDHEGSASSLSGILVEEGYHVDKAVDGQEALERAVCSPVPYDLFVTDVVMPRMSGPELIGHVHEIHPSTHIICTTSSAAREEIRHCYAAGAKALWLKPFDAAKIRASLSQLEKAPSGTRRRVRPTAGSWFGRLRQGIERDKGKKTFVRSAWQLAILGLTLIAVLGTVLHFKGYLKAPFQRANNFLNRVEGYLERDEQREIDREHDREK